MGYVGVPPQSGFITTAKQRVTSSTNNYVDLDHSISSLADVIVWVNFVKQSYTNLTLTTSTRITLGGTLVASDIVEVAYLGKAVATQTPDTGTVTNDMLAGSIDLTSKVTGSLPQANIADQAINEAKLQISNAPTNGYMLTAQSGNTGGLTWAEAGGGTLELISTHSQTSGVSSITMDNLFSTTYNVYRVFIRYLRPQTNDTEVRMQMLDTSGVRTNTAYRYAVLRIRDGGEDNYHNSGNTSFLLNTGTYNSEQQGGANFDMTIRTFRSATGDQYTFNMDYRSATARNNNQASTFIGSGHYNEKNSDHPANGLKFFMDSGNIDRVFISVYGVKGAV